MLASVTFIAAFAGCLDEEECSPAPDADTLSIGYGIEATSRSGLSFRFDCEASEADYAIDRYTFFFRTPAIDEFRLEPKDRELSPDEEGSATYFVKDGLSPTTTRPAPPFYTVNFTKWDPALNADQEPLVTIGWVSDAQPPEYDLLPAGIYEIKVGLRSGADEGGWLDVGV